MATKGRGITITRTPAAAAPVTACQHHWVIESPNGNPTVDARCKHCGAESFFYAAGNNSSYDPLSRENYDRRRAR